jgi:hypothetical protein
MWCPSCYSSLDNRKFFVAIHHNIVHDQLNVIKEKEEDRVESSLWLAITGDRSNDYLHARRGDHLMTCFECDLCVFRKLRNHNPRPKEPQDELLQMVIRRIILDAFWSRASSTVINNARVV